MHPDLLNNSLFLRYYTQWQKNPDSIVFASVADYFLRYNLVDDAHKICKAGLARHPDLTIGHIVMAKIHIARGNLEEAEEELSQTLQISSKNGQARDLLNSIEEKRRGEVINKAPQEAPDMPSEWQTATMAGIYASQGHTEKAKEIYHAILERDPNNEEANQGLAAINS